MLQGYFFRLLCFSLRMFLVKLNVLYNQRSSKYDVVRYAARSQNCFKLTTCPNVKLVLILFSFYGCHGFSSTNYDLIDWLN